MLKRATVANVLALLAIIAIAFSAAIPYTAGQGAPTHSSIAR